MKIMKINKGILALIGSFMSAITIVAITCAILVSGIESGTPIGMSDNITDEAAAVNTPSYNNCILREHNGIIGIFSTDGKLVGEISVAVVTLPASERQRLVDGIRVDSPELLASLIESYTG